MPAISRDGSKTWELATQPPGGYRSAVGKYAGGFVAVGPTGTETSADGLRWNSIGKVNPSMRSGLAFRRRELGCWSARNRGEVLDQTKYLI